MASILPSCIGNTFCSHRKAAYFLLAALIPFFFPFLIICLPFFIIFLPPMSVLGCSLFLLHKAHVSIRKSRSGKGTVMPRPGLEEEMSSNETKGERRQESLPEHKESDRLNVQSLPALGGGDEKNSLITPESDDVRAVRHDDVKELDARREMRGKQEETNSMEETMENTDELSSGFGGERAVEEPDLMEEMREDRKERSGEFGPKKAEQGDVEVLSSSSSESSHDRLNDDAREFDIRHEMDEKQEEWNLTEETREDREDMSRKFGPKEADEGGLEVLGSSSPESSLDRPIDDNTRHGMGEKQEEPNITEETREEREDISRDFGPKEAEEGGLEMPPSSSPESSLDHPNDDDIRHQMDEKQEELNLTEETREDREDISRDFGPKEAEEGGLEVLGSSSPESYLDRPIDDANELDVRHEMGKKQEEPNSTEETKEDFGLRKAEEGGLKVLPSSSAESSLDRSDDDPKELDTRHEMGEKQEEPNLPEETREDRKVMSSDFGPKEAEEGGLEVLPSSSPESSFDRLNDDAKELDTRYEMAEKQEEPDLTEETREDREDRSINFGPKEAKEGGLEVLPSSSPDSSIDHLNDDAKGLDMRPEMFEKQEAPILTEEEREDREDMSSDFGSKEVKEGALEVLPSSNPESSLDHPNDDAKRLDMRHGKDEKRDELNLTEEMMENTESSGFDRGKAEEQLNSTKREDLSSGQAKEEGFEVLPSSSPESFLDRQWEEQEVMEGLAPDQEEKPMKAEGEPVMREGMDSSDPLFPRTTSSDHPREKILTEVPSSHEHGRPLPSFEATPVSRNASNISMEEQFHDPAKDLLDVESVPESLDEFYEVPANLPDTEPNSLESMAEFDEVPGKDASSGEAETRRGQHFGQEPPLSSEKRSGFGHLSELEKQDLLTSMEKETEGDEPCGSLSTHHMKHEATRASAEGLRDDEQPQQRQEAEQAQEGVPGRDIDDKLHQERYILADIDAIKKIVGYEGDSNASIMEQITGLYLFLGMEPNWDAELEDLERAQTEVEVLKVVVGVK